MIQIKALASTDTATWPDEFAKVYRSNYLADQENEDCICKLDSEVVVIQVHSNKDIETNTCSISIPDNIGLFQTVNLPAKFKLCVHARLLLTDNISISNRLINGSIGKVKHLDRRSKTLCSTVYVEFDHPKAGNSLKDTRLCGELKQCVPIIARAKRFPLKEGKSTAIAEGKQFPLILGHAITVRKPQRSTRAYMQGDLNRSTGKKTATGKNCQQPGSVLHLTCWCQKS